MIFIECYGDTLELQGEDVQETIMLNFGWLLEPIIEQMGSFELAIQKLNWNINKK